MCSNRIGMENTMSLCFNLNGTYLTLSDEILNSEESIASWKAVFKRQADPEHYERFLRMIAHKRGLSVLPGSSETKPFTE